MCKKKDPNKKGFFAEFKEFITRGNVIDMAVGVIIGGAFTAIVTALTSGILQPFINWLISLCFQDKSGLEACRTILGTPVYTVVEGVKVVDWSKTNYIDWGTLISAIINFLLVALILFLIIKGINAVHQAGVEAKEKLAASKKKGAKEEEPKPEEAEEKAE